MYCIQFKVILIIFINNILNLLDANFNKKLSCELYKILVIKLFTKK